tara:strand:+ start:92 stop:382 length:291 start_codon:yes stop_codon:yes gene_type:complete
MKLKQLLEGYAWERKAGAPLPTLADATAKHEQNIKEQTRPINDPQGDQFNYNVDFEPDSAVVDAFNRVVASYRSATKGMNDDQAYSVSQQLTEFFS